MTKKELSPEQHFARITEPQQRPGLDFQRAHRQPKDAPPGSILTLTPFQELIKEAEKRHAGGRPPATNADLLSTLDPLFTPLQRHQLFGLLERAKQKRRDPVEGEAMLRDLKLLDSESQAQLLNRVNEVNRLLGEYLHLSPKAIAAREALENRRKVRWKQTRRTPFAHMIAPPGPIGFMSKKERRRRRRRQEDRPQT